MADDALAADAAVDNTTTPETHVSIDDAISKAFDAVEATPDDPVEAVVSPTETGTDVIPDGDATDAPERGPDGRFKPKEGDDPDQPKADAAPADATQEDAVDPVDQPATQYEAPTRFSPDAKAAWKDAPPAIQAEINRAVTELESGIEGYREKLTQFDGLDEYSKLAADSGTTIKDALTNYVNLERQLASDPLKGLETVAEYAGLSLREVAAHIMGQTPDQSATQQDATMRELRQHIAGLEKQIGGVTETVKSQQQTSIEREVSAFADSKDNPRFNELSDTISQLITNGMATDLPKAYEMAERLNPAPAPTATAPAAGVKPDAPKPDLTAQTRKGSLSIKGSPTSGSTPAAKKPSSSTEEALDNAFASVGL